MKKVHVPLDNRSYDVLIENGILNNIDLYIDKSKQIVIITDDGIPTQYQNIIKPKLKDPLLLTIPQGEQSKSMETAQLLINQMIENNVTRHSTIIALGGGVVGDLAGFVASIYMRGVDFIQVPTTLLSQIDSSVGGKVAVNAIKMKNAIGTFYQPKVVLIDPSTLFTLNPRQLNSGFAEMIKYGLIASKSLFYNLFNNNSLSNIDELIYECVTIKRNIVIQDEKDLGIRQILNYGHTIGHAIEQYSNYDLLHGEAISIGMYMMSKNTGFHQELKQLLNKYNLPHQFEYDKETLFNYILTDKKATRNKLNIILVEELGKAFIKPILIEEIKERI
jgi:3-dehydroquinate synthase